MADADDKLPLLTLLECSCLSTSDVGGLGDAHRQHVSSSDRSANIHNIIRLFIQSGLHSVQGVINKENETAMFYILRMCFDYGECDLSLYHRFIAAIISMNS